MTAVVETTAFDPVRDPLTRKRRFIIAGFSILLFFVSLVALGTGAVAISPFEILAILLSEIGLPIAPTDDLHGAVVLAVRLPRILLALVVGAALGICGAVLQALFRNPLADPTLIGVSGGAACGAVAWIVLGGIVPAWLVGTWSMPIAAFAAGLLTTVAVYLIARTGSRVDVAMLLLAGLAMNALTGAILGYLTYLGNEQQVRALTFWLLGSLGGATWDTIAPAIILSLVAMGVLIPMARSFDVFALGETEAARLGVHTERLKIQSVIAVALAVGSGVALTGMIGFVGLLAPHIVRLLGGASNRFVLPGAALTGALLIVLADIIARIAVVPAELPIGVVTSSIGAPFFFWLLRTRMRPNGAMR